MRIWGKEIEGIGFKEKWNWVSAEVDVWVYYEIA